MTKDTEADRQKAFLAWLNGWLGTGKGKSAAKSGKELAELLGLTPSQVTRIRQGKRPLKVEELRIIESYIGEPAPGYGVREGSSGPMRQVDHLPVTVVIAPGVWREAGATVMSNEIAFRVPDKDLSGIEQYACALESDQNRVVICVPYSKMRAFPHSGDLVHVVRKRGDLEEHTFWTVDGEPGKGFWLVSESPTRHRIPFPRNGSKDAQVRGLAVYEQFKRKY